MTAAGTVKLSDAPVNENVQVTVGAPVHDGTAFTVDGATTRPTVAKASRKDPEQMTVIIEDLIKLLDGMSTTFHRGKHPDSRDAKKIAAVLRAVADDIDV